MIDFNLYLITDRTLVQNNNIAGAVEEALKGGVKAVQLREKDLKIRELLSLAYKMRDLTKSYGAKLFINDRVDVAVATCADGVHLGRKSMPPWAARKVRKDLIIGVSTHSIEEATRAEQEGADLITLGPIFHTPSKAAYGEPIGLEILREVCSSLSIPVLAIGGIKPDRIEDIKKMGAKGVAVISAILGSEDIRNSTEIFLRSLK